MIKKEGAKSENVFAIAVTTSELTVGLENFLQFT